MKHLLVFNKIKGCGGGSVANNSHSEFKEITVLSPCDDLTKCIFTVCNT